MQSVMRLVVVLSLAAFVGCSGITVSSDYAASTDFTKLKTFAWLPKSQEEYVDHGVDNSLVRTRIQDAVATELAAKGYLEIIAGSGDFLVTYHARTQEKIQVQPRTGPMIGRPWGGGYADVYQYEEGTLIIDFIQPKTQQLIWRGIAKEAVNWQEAPERGLS